LFIVAAAVALLAGFGGCAGLARDGAIGPGTPESATPAATGSGTAGPMLSDRAAIYTAMLRRYLTTSDHSFGDDHRFPIAYVLDQTDSAAVDPMPSGQRAQRAPISPADQKAIVAALADVGPVRFISDRKTVIEEKDRCQQVRGGGVLIILAPPAGGGDRVEVGIHGFVACLGATWFTYVVVRDGGGWQVTGTTGPMAIA